MRKLFFVFIAVVLSVTIASESAQAELAPPGAFIDSTPHPWIAVPPGSYRTRMVWLVASAIEFERTRPFGIFNAAAPGVLAREVNKELARFGQLSGPEYYLYSEALVRDYAQLQILLLADDRIGLALAPAVSSVVADVVATIAVVGVVHVLPEVLGGVRSAFVPADAAATAQVGQKLAAWQLRYKDLVGPAIFEHALREIGSGVTADRAAELVTTATLSSAINRSLEPYRSDPGRMFDAFRTQAVLSVASYQCACVLDQNTHRMPSANVAVLGPLDTYRTALGFLLAYRLAPPPTTLLNIFGGRAADDLLRDELAKLRRLRQSNRPVDRAQYGSYLRSLLVDVETLERAMISSLSAGSAREFLDSAVMNVMFGAIGTAAGGSGPAIAILANAGVGIFLRYGTVSAELQVRMQVAAFREFLLNELLPLSEVCGCGEGVVVVPDRVIQGTPASRQ